MMMYQPALQDITYQDYPIQYPLSGRSTEEMDISEILDSLFSIWIRQKRPKEIFYQNLLSLLEIDLSSVWPHYEIKSETSLMEIKEISEEMIVAGMIKYDFIVQIPPIRECTLRVRIKSIEKATPHIVEPKGI